jgi:hypothetical protein
VIAPRVVPAVMRDAVREDDVPSSCEDRGYSQYVFGMLPLIAMSTRFTQAEPVG